MRIVFVTQAVDLDDPVLGATEGMLRALAGRCDQLEVVTVRAGRHRLPENATFRLFEASHRPLRALRFARALAPALVRPRADAVIAHMAPVYAVAAAPLAKPLRVPLLLWYTQWRIDPALRAAARLCDAIVSVATGSFPLDSDKVAGIGHGIDLADFPARDAADGDRRRLSVLTLGRTSPSKGYLTLIEAVERAAERGLDVELEIRGPSETNEERRHRRELVERIQSGPIRDRVRLEPALPRPEIPPLLRRFDVFANMRGDAYGPALDKVVFEAAASAVPVLACAPGFDSLLGGLPVELMFSSGDADDLADKLVAFARASPEARAAAGRELRRRVEAAHSTDTWAAGVVQVVRGLQAGGR